MKILLSGATGFVGQYLTKELLKNDHQLYALVKKTSDTRLDPSIVQLTLSSLQTLDEQIDVFINLAGENIAARPWTAKRKEALFQSRVTLTKQVRLSLKHPVKRLISMSAVGFYGISRHGTFTEETMPKQGFAHELCRAWEDAANEFIDDGTQVVVFRLGVVLGNGGALEKMRLPFLCGLGGPIAGGQQWFSWIHIADVIGAIMAAMSDASYEGTYNLVAPQFITQKRFSQAYASSLNRPAVLPTPRWTLNLIFGEMASLLTEGAKIAPQKLEKRGFRFQFHNIDDALSDIANGR
ncbi:MULTISPECIES: TIGR01777 family oxidoreductase [Marinomonas]|uniref:TIGR01777 family protein n=1 Tax=Marinomonas arctica TaxID=383750 RepID=A0A7H1JBM5_9GAMM|nr:MULTISPECIES: TIGR01777 family oxidoreductase [Marinomonas]MCS7485590.1 hypothetical protein [Marinomonas sp. BSi20414]QNT07891.1 TIGR01777 family protein [Marinomonas arctica]GGN26119.1 epimerase [Marinomonas arctica]